LWAMLLAHDQEIQASTKPVYVSIGLDGGLRSLLSTTGLLATCFALDFVNHTQLTPHHVSKTDQPLLKEETSRLWVCEMCSDHSITMCRTDVRRSGTIDVLFVDDHDVMVD